MEEIEYRVRACVDTKEHLGLSSWSSAGWYVLRSWSREAQLRSGPCRLVYQNETRGWHWSHSFLGLRTSSRANLAPQKEGRERAKFTEDSINNFAVRVEVLQLWVSPPEGLAPIPRDREGLLHARYYPPKGKHEAAKYEKLDEIKSTNTFCLTRGKRFGLLLEANREEEYAAILGKSETDRGSQLRER